MKKKIAILGATGSIGCQTLSVIAQYRDQFDVTLLTANQNLKKLMDLALNHQSYAIGLHSDINYLDSSPKIRLLQGNQEIISFFKKNQVDFLVIATDSVHCYEILAQVYPFVQRILISSKEILILAGISKLLVKIKKTTELLPLDSEHVAIHQLMRLVNKNQIRRIVLTASGGPFYSKEGSIDLSDISPEKALKHPTWLMGKKVTIDSSTLVNKGIELMEAMYLFKLPIDKLTAIIHPESIIHSFCEMIDGSLLCQMAYPNMELPIAYSLFYPKKQPISSVKNFNFTNFPDLTFRKVSTESIPSVNLAIQCMKMGEIKQLLYLIADDVAVHLFLNHKIKFCKIVPFMEKIIFDPSMPAKIHEEDILNQYLQVKQSIIDKYETMDF